MSNLSNCLDTAQPVISSYEFLRVILTVSGEIGMKTSPGLLSGCGLDVRSEILFRNIFLVVVLVFVLCRQSFSIFPLKDD